MSKVKAKVSPAVVLGSADEDIKLSTAWLNFKKNLLTYYDGVENTSVELQFESSYDERTHHTFNADEVVFLNDIVISPEGSVTFCVPFGTKEKTFKFEEAELINVEREGTTEQLNNVVTKIFREAFSDFSDIKSVTMLERKYIAPNVDVINMLNNAEEFIATIELTKDRSKLYTALENYGIF